MSGAGNDQPNGVKSQRKRHYNFKSIAALIALIDDGKVSHSAASQKIFPVLCASPEKAPLKIAEELDLIQESDSGQLEEWVDAALAAYPDKVEEYRGGKKRCSWVIYGRSNENE